MIFPQDPKIDIGTDGFAGKDLLGRKEFGQRLTDLVDRIEQPLVIALDGEWGSGKSHFLKLWAGGHKHELNGKAEVIYFDAFEHDFLDDPLVSLVSRLAQDQAAKGWSQRAVDGLKKAAFPLAKLGLRVGLFAASAGVSELVGAVGDAVASKVAESADGKFTDFWNREEGRISSMQGFRDALTALTIKEDGTTQKIVFIIDELDRCRPDYALNLLEIIKHFFAVPNVHFVLGVNLHALEHSVRARYGQGIDAAKYLQKFVMLTMTLPRKDSYRSELSVTKKYYDSVAARFIMSVDLKGPLDRYLDPLFANELVSIRDIQRILSVMALFSGCRGNLSIGYTSLLVGAALLKVLHPAAYAKLRKHTLPLDELVKLLVLEPWKQVASGPRTDRQWIIWAIMLAKDRLVSEGIPPEEIARCEKLFDDYDDPFNWHVADTYLTEAFDTFTFPDTP